MTQTNREDGNGGESDTEAARAHAHREVLEFEVPEGSRSVRARVVPKVTVEDGEIHARVEVDDPNWIRDPEDHDTADQNTKDHNTAEQDHEDHDAQGDGTENRDTGNEPPQPNGTNG